jgi:hypothetical protein
VTGLSLRGAINAKCRDCIFDELERGRWLQQVDACTIRECSLWAVRPRSGAAGCVNSRDDSPAKVAVLAA